MKKNRNNPKGFSLLEVLIATFILVVGILGMIGLISRSITSAIEDRQAIIAAGLAQEGIELVRNIRDTNMMAQLNDVGKDGNLIFKTNLPQNSDEKCIIDINSETYHNGDEPIKVRCSEPESLYLSPETANFKQFYTHEQESGATLTAFKRYVSVAYETNSEGVITGMEVTSRVFWSDSEPGTCSLATRCVEIQDFLPRRD